jgi:hypothetical protein
MTRLHIVNGESSLLSLPLAEVGGEAFAWFDFLSEGPPPDGTEAGWRRRAEELANRYGLDAGQHFAAAQAWRQRLEGAGACEEVVLWFEGDLFCLWNLAFLLDWFSRHPHPALSLVCPPDERLGALQPERLTELFAGREPLTPAMLDDGHAAWQALSSADPAVIERALHEAAEPLFQRAMRLQLERFPRGVGPSGVEKHLLSLLGSESQRLGRLFKAFNESDLGFQFGWGDHQFAVLLVDMRRRGLLAIEPAPGQPPYQDFGAWLVSRA